MNYRSSDGSVVLRMRLLKQRAFLTDGEGGALGSRPMQRRIHSEHTDFRVSIADAARGAGVVASEKLGALHRLESDPPARLSGLYSAGSLARNGWPVGGFAMSQTEPMPSTDHQEIHSEGKYPRPVFCRSKTG